MDVYLFFYSQPLYTYVRTVVAKIIRTILF